MISCSSDQKTDFKIESIENPAQISSRYPNLYGDGSGNIYISWLEKKSENSFGLFVSTLQDMEWSKPELVYEGTDFFINWADFPSVVGINGKPVAAHWLKKVEGGPFSYHVQISFRNTDGNWETPITPHLDRSPTEHGFVSMIPLSNNQVLAVWLDGRNTSGNDHHNSHDTHGHANLDAAMTLRSAEINSSGTITRKNIIDSAVCDCCQTSLAPVTNGAIVAYRDRTENEIRDISIAHYDFSKGNWSEPSSISSDNWEIGGCPVNGPKIASDQDNIVITWFTAPDRNPRVLAISSTDGGNSFTSPIRIDLGTPAGRVDALIDKSGNKYVSWVESVEGQEFIYFRQLSINSLHNSPFRVKSIDRNRGSGFPRFVKTQNGFLFAFTETEPYSVKTIFLTPID